MKQVGNFDDKLKVGDKVEVASQSDEDGLWYHGYDAGDIVQVIELDCPFKGAVKCRRDDGYTQCIKVQHLNKVVPVYFTIEELHERLELAPWQKLKIVSQDYYNALNATKED